jgi:hypothetical protein
MTSGFKEKKAMAGERRHPGRLRSEAFHTRDESFFLNPPHVVIVQ